MCENLCEFGRSLCSKTNSFWPFFATIARACTSLYWSFVDWIALLKCSISDNYLTFEILTLWNLRWIYIRKTQPF